MKKKLSLVLIVSFLLVASCSENRLVEPSGPASGQDSDRIVPAENRAGADKEQGIEKAKQANATQPVTTAGRSLKSDAFLYEEGTLLRAAPGQYQLLPPPGPLGRFNRESYNAIEENGFINCLNDSLSTFSIDVDTASYANVRRMVFAGTLPPAGAVRTEEMINYFSYNYPQPTGNEPFSLTAEVGASPFNTDYSLVRIGLKAKDFESTQLPPANLVFLIDVSGSMDQPNKLPLLKQSLKMLVKKLRSQDRLSIVVYAGSDRVVLTPTSGDEQRRIGEAIDNLQAGGSTHASRGILTAYQLARQAYMPRGNNRVILVSDGDFNVGVTSRSELQALIEKQRESGIYLTVLGFGDGNFHDDTMELLADKGNGNYAYIDSLLEAKKVLVKEMGGTLFTLADDVKIQVEFNPASVGAYRLIGYENRALADEDFRDDAKDAGEIGAGHEVTALYELIPTGHAAIPQVDKLKYQRTAAIDEKGSHELLTVKLRYKPSGSKTSTELSTIVKKPEVGLATMSEDFRFAAAVAGYAMLLKKSSYIKDFTWDACMQLAKGAKGRDEEGYRAEFIRMVEMSQLLVDNG